MRILRTERLTLEPVTLANADPLWRIMQAGNLRDYQEVPLYTIEEFRDRVASRPKKLDAQASGRFEWLISLNVTFEPIGWVSLRLGECVGSTAEMGYSILEPSRKHGYAGESVRAVLDETLLTAKLDAVEAACVVENEASRRLLDALGFARLRVQHRGAVVRSRAVDIYIYRMEREAWGRLRFIRPLRTCE
jgi:[ribosomal protein S5]-alanine N-acetyltransferase